MGYLSPTQIEKVASITSESTNLSTYHKFIDLSVYGF